MLDGCGHSLERDERVVGFNRRAGRRCNVARVYTKQAFLLHVLGSVIVVCAVASAAFGNQATTYEAEKYLKGVSI